MQTFLDYGIPEKKVKQLNKVGITTVEDLLSFYPKAYKDRSEITGILTPEEESVFLMDVAAVAFPNSKISIVKVSGKEVNSGSPITVLWFNQPYLYNEYLCLKGKRVLVAGKIRFVESKYGNEPDHYEVTVPDLFTDQIQDALGIYPVYRRIPGMSQDYLQKCLYNAISKAPAPPAETLSESILGQYGLMSHADMILQLHWPESMEQLEEAQRRRRWDDLLYFALRVELNYLSNAVGSPFSLPVIRAAREMQKSLPFELTTDQQGAIDAAVNWIRSGKRLNALIQGDVGCGKTIVVMYLMIAFAENGYQAALMAPTHILAEQHYRKLKDLAEPLGLEVAFISGEKKTSKQLRDLQEGLSSGNIRLAVGTQALLSDTYQFKNLALVVEDEEHKYGVMQRQALTDKAAAGTHTVTLSATPIPRSLAQTIYGDNLQLFSIRTKPAGRQPIRTGINKDGNKLLNFLRKEIKENNRQVYVVCPKITLDDDAKKEVFSVEAAEKWYRENLRHNGISIGTITGKMKKADSAECLRAFERGEIDILIATSMVEVGVDVPNASTIVIHSAERFGLAQLHQLRGRVGRGPGDAWCVLVSGDQGNPRLQAMCKHSDGFKIAELDLAQRGAGDLLGNHQSGTEKYLALALQNSEEYRDAQAAAKYIIHQEPNCLLLEKAMRDHSEKQGGEML